MGSLVEIMAPKVPKINGGVFDSFRMPSNYKNYDIGFCSFDVPDNVSVHGYLGSEKYFKHCEDLIRHYFLMKELCEPYRDCIIINYNPGNNNYYNYPRFANF